MLSKYTDVTGYPSSFSGIITCLSEQLPIPVIETVYSPLFPET
jgi:hypothetical protein